MNQCVTSESVPGGDLSELDQVDHVDGADVVLAASQMVSPVPLNRNIPTIPTNVFRGIYKCKILCMAAGEKINMRI